MQEKQTPNNQETTKDRLSQSLFNVEHEPERPREEAFENADDRDELPFDLPRD